MGAQGSLLIAETRITRTTRSKSDCPPWLGRQTNSTGVPLTVGLFLLAANPQHSAFPDFCRFETHIYIQLHISRDKTFQHTKKQNTHKKKPYPVAAFSGPGRRMNSIEKKRIVKEKKEIKNRTELGGWFRFQMK